MELRKSLWHLHPHVRSDAQLTLGERAADVLKRVFGSWPFIGILNLFIAVWALANWTGIAHFDIYPFILLNLILSWLAAQQGGALQIAANRGDRIASELAMHTYDNGVKLLALNEAQLAILTELRALRSDIADHIDSEDHADDLDS